VPPQDIPTLTSGNETQEVEKESVHPFAEQLVKRSRDPKTGLLAGYEYTFDDFGRVDWEALVPTQYFYPRKESFTADTDFSTLDVSTLSPQQRVLNLEGIKFLMDLRGAKNITMQIGSASTEYASVSHRIEWEPCIDQGMKEYSTVGCGDAHSFNNVEPFKYVLLPLAMNKSLSSSVRAATRVHTYTVDELRGGDSKKNGHETEPTSHSGSLSPLSALKEKMSKVNIGFNQIKNTYIKEGKSERATEDQITLGKRAEEWTDESSIKALDIFVIITRLNDKLKKVEK